MKRAYSLVRFSSWRQSKGQSQRRQAEWSAAWCEKNKCLLDESLHWDKPVSAFRERQPHQGRPSRLPGNDPARPRGEG